MKTTLSIVTAILATCVLGNTAKPNEAPANKLAKAREEAAQRTAIERTRRIGHAVIEYYGEHRKFPETLVDLVNDKRLAPQDIFFRQEDGGLVSAVYYPGDFGAEKDPIKTKLIESRPADIAGSVVVFLDGHVELLKSEKPNKAKKPMPNPPQ